ncbi:MAG: MFS transporter [Gammaproteobacteria bacterium]|nr:MFS transporter [Gammaproteobacteria bacterium]
MSPGPDGGVAGGWWPQSMIHYPDRFLGPGGCSVVAADDFVAGRRVGQPRSLYSAGLHGGGRTHAVSSLDASDVLSGPRGMSQVHTAGPTPARGLRIGPLHMQPGVELRHVLTLFFASFFGIATMSFINASQPYVLTEILGVPFAEQGRVSGRLVFIQEIVLLTLLTPIGAISDKFGRKPVYAAAFFVMGAAYFLYPLAGAIWMLLLFRMVFAAGVAGNAVMLPAVANDYPQDKSRARTLAACFICNGLGLVLILAVMRGLPVRFADMGLDTVTAGRYWLWTMSGVCLVVGSVILLGLKPGAPEQLKPREPMLSTFRIGIRAARNPRILLAYLAASVSRGDMAVLSTFFVLWLTQAGVSEGLSTAAASQKALTFYIVIQAFALPAAPIMGYVLDRIDRVIGLAIAMSFAGVGYFSLWLVPDPLGPAMYLAAALIGVGEMSANLSATSLIGQEAPERGRGAVLGMWSWFGAAGILVVASLGGWLFDHVSKLGPFMFVAAANIALLLWALVLLRRSRPARA